MELLNPNPRVYEIEDDDDAFKRSRAERGLSALAFAALDEGDAVEPVDAFEVFEHVRHINDPEHPLTLEQLHVLERKNIDVSDTNNSVKILFTPTIPHCSMATLIGLSIRVKLLRSLPPRFKVDVLVTPGSHNSEDAVNKQLNDKERVAAALENAQLLGIVNRCIAHTERVA